MHVILSSGFAGSERYAAELASFQAAEHDVMLVVRRTHRSRFGTSVVDALSTRVLVSTVPRLLGTQRSVQRRIQEFLPDVIHTHLRRSARIIARARPDASSVATLHNRANGPHFFELDGLICNGHWQVREIPPTYRGKVFKLNQLFTPHRRLDTAEIAGLRESLGVAPDQYLVGAVARLAHSKGLDHLIEAFRAADLPNARLVILGEGRERRRLERLLGPNMSMPGFRKNIKDYYQAFDLFVCPSRREPLPLVMLEAYDAGLQVVASTADGCRELIEEFGGDLFPIGDIARLAAILRNHASAPRQRRTYDLSPHFIENVNRTIIEAYNELIAARRQRT
ncbi:MAG TPA: glycosyltransferase family 4 protein [Steroidobacteraceae bacterium]|jgi:glycosyltransferase involved in cell wall biosynthesis|nr:glycosyltransferase family 4 protein [Steroidobacteraceae bacterium]